MQRKVRLRDNADPEPMILPVRGVALAFREYFKLEIVHVDILVAITKVDKPMSG